MKKLFLLVMVVPALVTLLSAQELEKVIYLPDSLAGLVSADRLAVAPGTGEVYAGGGDGNCVVVFDGLTGEKRARIPLPGGVARMCYVPVETTVFCLSSLQDTVYVIDARRREVVHRIGLGARLGYLVYAAIPNKIYLSGPGSNRVVVIDCHENRVSGEVLLPGVGGAAVFSRCFERVYCFVSRAGGNLIAVIDGNSEQIIDSILLGEIGVEQMIYNPVVKKIYTIDGRSGDVAIVDCWTNSVLRHWVSEDVPVALCLNPDRNKVYLGESGGDVLVKVISGEDDSIVGVVEGDNRGARSLVFDPNRDRVYALDFLTPLWAIDCARDSVVGVLRYESGESLYFSPELNRIYTTQTQEIDGHNDVAIIEPESLTISTRVPLYFYPVDAQYARREDKLYCSGYVAGSGASRLVVIDGAGNRIVAEVELPERGAGPICYSRVGGKVFVNGETLMAVVNCTSDSLERTISLPGVPGGGFAVFYQPVVNKIYRVGYAVNNLLVFGCAQESVVAMIPWNGGAVRWFGFNPGRSRTYITAADGVWLIDSEADTVVKTIEGDFGGDWCYVPARDWVVGAADWSLWAIGGTSDTVDTVVNLNHTVDAMAYDPARDKLYIASTPGGMVYIYQGRSLRRLGFLPVPARPIGLKVDTSAGLVFCQHPDLLTVIDGKSNSIVATVPHRAREWAPVVNPNFPRFYVLDTTTAGIAVWRRQVIGMEEVEPRCQGAERAIPTVVRAFLILPEKEGGMEAGFALFDISGRRVLELKPGVNDVRRLPAGLYLICEKTPDAERWTRARVIIQH